MAKKKQPDRSSKRKGGSGLAWLFALSVLVIFILVVQLQEKDKRIAGLTGKARSGNSLSTEGGNQSAGSTLDKEKVKSAAEAALPKLIGKPPSTGSSWYLDGVKFLKNDCITISYEDGHTFGSITCKVINPSDPDTWIKQ